MFESSNLQIEYVDGEFDEPLLQNIEDVPFAYSYYDSGETYLSGKVLGYRWVSNKSALECRWVKESKIEDDVPLVLRVDYQHLLIPADFDAGAPERIERRQAHIFISASELGECEFSMFGLAHHEWVDDTNEELSLSQCDLSDEESRVTLKGRWA